ncbi:dihydropteroate synthase [bacterium BMS3Bbin02]|nr:dihydropteroate synthase [bacterium BMS3Bbin02]
MEPESVAIDPGIGFGKTLDHNVALLADLRSLVELGYPVLLGASRKGSLGLVLRSYGFDIPAADRDPATAATTALAISQGISIVRAHNVASTVQVARIADAIVATRINNISGSERSSWQV